MRVGLYDENANLLAEPEFTLQNKKETVLDLSDLEFDRNKVYACIPNVGDLTFIQIL